MPGHMTLGRKRQTEHTMAGLYNNLLDFLNTSGMYELTCSDVFIAVNLVPREWTMFYVEVFP